MTFLNRRDFLRQTSALTGAAFALGPMAALAEAKPGSKIRLGLVTYLWGAKWDLPTLLSNCEKGNVLGVELRTTHAHGVEPSLNARQRTEVRKRFDDSPVVNVGIGSNERFDHADPAALKTAIEATKEFVKLSQDVGGSGVKVKPDGFPKGVDRNKTIEQIGESLNIVGAFAADYGQQIRLEVHGQCSPPPIMKRIMDVADHPNVFICWNSNAADLEGEGLEYNFNLLKDRFGATLHIRQLEYPKYPFQELLDLLVAIDYDGWALLECHDKIEGDPVARLAGQAELFEEMVAKARTKA